MYLRIYPESQTPIYTQLIYQIKTGILKKEIKSGESLPSVRILAGDIGINMHTVNKAYKILVNEGVLVQQKKGFMVNPKQQPEMTNIFKEEFKERLEELMIDERIYQLSAAEILQIRSEIEKKLEVEE